jgi:hypothetical protein
MPVTLGDPHHVENALAEQKRHNEALEKILAGHEDRLQKLEGDKRSQISD